MMLISLLLTTEKTIVHLEKVCFFGVYSVSLAFYDNCYPFFEFSFKQFISIFQKAKANKNLITIGFCVTLIGLNFNYFKPESYLDDPQKMYYTDAKRIRHEMSGILPDYIPQNLVDEPEPVDQLILSKHPDEYEILVDRTHQKLVRTDFNEDAQLDLAVASYPGWKAEINGQKVSS